MPDEKRQNAASEGLSDEELEQQDSELLEDREVMTILPIEPTGPGITLPVEPPE
jgi:hypothetical protein